MQGVGKEWWCKRSYRLKWNSFSSSRVWYLVYVCRPRFRSKTISCHSDINTSNNNPFSTSIHFIGSGSVFARQSYFILLKNLTPTQSQLIFTLGISDNSSHSLSLISSSFKGRLTIRELTELAAHPGAEGTGHRGTLGASGGHRTWLKQLKNAKKLPKILYNRCAMCNLCNGTI